MNYSSLQTQISALWVGRWLTDIANTSAFIFSEFKDINWVGFYLFDGKGLVLGPFQGKPACTDIAIGRGVCGKAFMERKTLRVADVHQFSDHITCDPLSRSELVVPLILGDQVLGVLDIDSPLVNRFTDSDQKFFEELVEELLKVARPNLSSNSN